MTGSIKTKTPKYKFIIPQFNIATWHDYIEDNFRAIDALFFNIFDIQNFSGSWTKTTEYKKDQVLFIGEDYEVDETGQLKRDDQNELIESEYSGRLVKVLKNHTTDNSDYFSLYYFNHKDEYELFADASTAQKFANLAKQYSENAQQSENNAELYKNNAQEYAQEAENSKNIAQQNAQLATNKAESAASSATIAKNSENSAASSATLAEGYKNEAKKSADSANKSESVAAINAQIVNELVQEPNLVAVGTDLRSASSNIKNISNISEQIKNVSDNMSYIRSVDNNKENINKAVTNETNITTVAENINNVNITAQNKDNIDTVVSYKDAITTTSTNINAVNNVSENMADVKNAVQSANDAKLWAVGTKTEKPEGSSKYWAEEAKNAVQASDATETVKGIVRLATSEEVTAGTNDSAVITPLKFKQKIVQDLSNPTADKIPSTKAVSDESSRIESIMNTELAKRLKVDETTSGKYIVLQTSKLNSGNQSDVYLTGYAYSSTDNNNLTYCAPAILTNGILWNRLGVHKKINGVDIFKQISVGVDVNGGFHSEAEPSNENNSIVTTVSHSSNYVRFGNGLIIQWIYFLNTGATTWIFPTPFSNTNYAILSNAAVWYNTANKQTTSIQITDTNFGNQDKFMSYYLLAIGY